MKKVCVILQIAIFIFCVIFMSTNDVKAQCDKCVTTAVAASQAAVVAELLAIFGELVFISSELLIVKGALYDPETMKSITTVIRDFQTSNIANLNILGGQITEAIANAGSVSQLMSQETKMMEEMMDIQRQYSTITEAECALWRAQKNMGDSKNNAPGSVKAEQEIIKKAAGGGAKQRTVAESSTTMYNAPAKVRELAEKGGKYVDAGSIFKPGCVPVAGSTTMFSGDSKQQVIEGFVCGDKDADAMTIQSEDDVQRSQEFVARVIVPNPLPNLPENLRSGVSGELYEAERALIRMRQTLHGEIGQESLTRLALPTRDVSNEDTKKFFETFGVPVHGTHLSEMDYLKRHVMARYDNHKHMAYIKTNRNDVDMLREIYHAQVLQLAMQYRMLELAEKKTLAEVAFYEAMQDEGSRRKLENLRLGVEAR